MNIRPQLNSLTRVLALCRYLLCVDIETTILSEDNDIRFCFENYFRIIQNIGNFYCGLMLRNFSATLRFRRYGRIVAHEFKFYVGPKLQLRSTFVWIISFEGNFRFCRRFPAILMEKQLYSMIIRETGYLIIPENDFR